MAAHEEGLSFRAERLGLLRLLQAFFVLKIFAGGPGVENPRRAA